MKIQKSAAAKTLLSATSNRFSAVRIDKDSTPDDKRIALREVVRDVEKLTRKSNQSVTVILVTD